MSIHNYFIATQDSNDKPINFIHHKGSEKECLSVITKELLRVLETVGVTSVAYNEFVLPSVIYGNVSAKTPLSPADKENEVIAVYSKPNPNPIFSPTKSEYEQSLTPIASGKAGEDLPLTFEAMQNLIYTLMCMEILATSSIDHDSSKNKEFYIEQLNGKSEPCVVDEKDKPIIFIGKMSDMRGYIDRFITNDPFYVQLFPVVEDPGLSHLHYENAKFVYGNPGSVSSVSEVIKHEVPEYFAPKLKSLLDHNVHTELTEIKLNHQLELEVIQMPQSLMKSGLISGKRSLMFNKVDSTFVVEFSKLAGRSFSFRANTSAKLSNGDALLITAEGTDDNFKNIADSIMPSYALHTTSSNFIKPIFTLIRGFNKGDSELDKVILSSMIHSFRHYLFSSNYPEFEIKSEVVKNHTYD